MEWALKNWNGKLAELWELITQSPATFKGGEIWTVITAISNALVGIGYGLLVLFFAMGVFQSAASFREIQRPEFALRHFIRFAGAKVAVGYSLEIMLAIFHICGGVVSSVMSGMGRAVSTAATLPTEIVSAIEDVGFLASIPLWLVSMLGSLIVTVLSFILILTVYGRFSGFTCTQPWPRSTGLLCRRGNGGKRKSVPENPTFGVCMEGAVVVLACLIYSAFLSSSSPAADASLPAVTMVWEYIGEMVFNMLVLTGLVRGASRITREMFGL